MATLPLAARLATACICDSAPAAAVLSQKPTGKKAVQSSRQGALSSSFIQGTSSLSAQCPSRQPAQRRVSRVATQAAVATEAETETNKAERFRLNNLGPQKGSRRKEKRKGRGIAAGQGASCGFGMRGQKSRSGSGVRPGFEGGQKPLYRRLPKLRGIAGGMPAGQTKFVTVNLFVLPQVDGVNVDLEYLKEQGFINASGRERDLRLKVLGDGDVKAKFTITAASFSATAREKLEAAGCTLIEEPGKNKFLPKLAAKRAAKLEEFLAKKNA